MARPQLKTITQDPIGAFLKSVSSVDKTIALQAISDIERGCLTLRTLFEDVRLQEVVPIVLKPSYTKEEADAERLRIEEAYRHGIVTYDKKRGLKMSVTKSTIGWSPDKKISLLEVAMASVLFD